MRRHSKRYSSRRRRVRAAHRPWPLGARSVLLLGWVSLAFPALAQDSGLGHALQAITEDASTASAWWGVYVYDLDRDTTVFALNEERSFMPASGTKLYTSAAALELLGPDFRYQTELLHDGTVEEGTLHGNLSCEGLATRPSAVVNSTGRQTRYSWRGWTPYGRQALRR